MKRLVRGGVFALAWVIAACGSRKADLRYQEGLDAANHDHPVEARKAWKDALALAPHRAGLRTNLAAIEPDTEVAKRLLEDELKQNPGLAEARFDRALLHARAGAWDKAEKQFAELAPKDPAAADLVDLCRMARGEALGAPPSATPATSPATDLGRWLRAREAWLAGDAAKAAAALDGANDALLKDLRAAFLLRAGDAAGAIAVAHSKPLQDLATLRAGRAPNVDPSATASYPDPALAVVALRIQAALASQAGKWSEALAALDSAWALAPSPNLRVERALALAWLDRVPEARADVAEALRALELEAADRNNQPAQATLARATTIRQALEQAP